MANALPLRRNGAVHAAGRFRLRRAVFKPLPYPVQAYDRLEVMRTVAALFAVTLLGACNSSSASASYVPWVPLPRGNEYVMLPSPSAPVAIPPGTAPCRAAQLEGQLVGSFGATNNLNTPVVLRNKSSTQCYLNGVPDLTIVDAQRVVLVKVAGADGVGTQFDQYIAAVDVLMAVGTPGLAESVGSPVAQNLAPGLAFLYIRWTGCSQEPASQLWIDLPDGGGMLVIAFPVVPPDLSTCSHELPLVRDPFKPTGVAWPPAPDYMQMQYRIDSPKTAKQGSTLEFFVTIRNLSSKDFTLYPCPDYSEALVTGGPVTYYQLNCAAAGAIKSGRSERFQMKFYIPSTTPTGPWQLLFGLVDGRITPPSATVPITIA